jgi:hypothetical protein
MIKKRSFRLADELLLFLLFLLPMMLVLGAAERTAQGPTLLFWLPIARRLPVLCQESPPIRTPEHHDRFTFTRTESAVSCKTHVESRQA